QARCRSCSSAMSVLIASDCVRQRRLRIISRRARRRTRTFTGAVSFTFMSDILSGLSYILKILWREVVHAFRADCRGTLPTPSIRSHCWWRGTVRRLLCREHTVWQTKRINPTTPYHCAKQRLVRAERLDGVDSRRTCRGY